MNKPLTIKVYYNDLKKKVKRVLRDMIDLYAIGRVVCGENADTQKLLYSYIDQDRDEIDLADQGDIDTLLSDIDDWKLADPGLALRIYVREPGTMRRWHDKYLRDAYVVDARTGMKKKYVSGSRKKEGFNSRPKIGKESPETFKPHLAAIEGKPQQLALPHKEHQKLREQQVEQKANYKIEMINRKAEQKKQELEKRLQEELAIVEKKTTNYGFIDLNKGKPLYAQTDNDKASAGFQSIIAGERNSGNYRHNRKYDEDRSREKNDQSQVLVFGVWVDEDQFEEKFSAMKKLHPHEKVGRLEKVVSRNLTKTIDDIEKAYNESIKKRNARAMFGNRPF